MSKNKKLPEIGLGVEVKDKVTGFKGIITSQTKWLTGCDQWGVQPICKKGEDLKDARCFDTDRLIVLGIGVKPEEVTNSVKPGGPSQIIPKKA